jgi:hypothetical protein
VPKVAKSRTSRDGDKRHRKRRGPLDRGLLDRSLAGEPFGITRLLAFRDLWQLALLGIMRRLALGAVQLLAP